MNENNPILKIRFDGEAVGPGRIPVAHLLRFLTNVNKALQRAGRVLTCDVENLRRGPPPWTTPPEHQGGTELRLGSVDAR